MPDLTKLNSSSSSSSGSSSSGSGNNKSKPYLKNMKNETATELGITNYDSMDKGTLSSRQNGYVGGYMTKKLVKYAEDHMSGGQQ
jgi:hypothetical protein